MPAVRLLLVTMVTMCLFQHCVTKETGKEGKSKTIPETKPSESGSDVGGDGGLLDTLGFFGAWYLGWGGVALAIYAGSRVALRFELWDFK
ncbi:Hypp5506 [Branchiostoma lanceolatum]|uniref:Hypp5506 protein n=1 Tax=Branchiostoma lanceolatum TaxID=7740 RepID=A0A8J9VHV5_BRALA|nr:Hypp5506 [Branchiostoma lanceolatum]